MRDFTSSSTRYLFAIWVPSAQIHELTNRQHELVKANFNDLGPMPRTCINFIKDPPQQSKYEKHCQGLISTLTSQSLREFVINSGLLNLDAKSHHLFLIRRFEVDDLSSAYLEPISAKVKMQIKQALDNLEQHDRIDLYHSFMTINVTREIAGILYESLGHLTLQEGHNLMFMPMTKIKKQNLFHWQRSNMMDNTFLVQFPCNPAVVYDVGLKSVKPNCLHVPNARNQPSIDSFIILDDTLYLFRFTVAVSHGIKDIDNSLSGILPLLPPKKNWRLVFITPPSYEVDVKADSEAEQSSEGVSLYLAHIEIERPSVITQRSAKKLKTAEPLGIAGPSKTAGIAGT